MRGSRGDDRDKKTIAVQSDAKNIQCPHWCLLDVSVCQGTREEKTNVDDVVVTKYERISVEKRMKTVVNATNEEKKEWSRGKTRKVGSIYLNLICIARVSKKGV